MGVEWEVGRRRLLGRTLSARELYVSVPSMIEYSETDPLGLVELRSCPLSYDVPLSYVSPVNQSTSFDSAPLAIEETLPVILGSPSLYPETQRSSSLLWHVTFQAVTAHHRNLGMRS